MRDESRSARRTVEFGKRSRAAWQVDLPLTVCAALVLFGPLSRAEAQTRHDSAALILGTGLTVGTSQGGAVAARSPLFVDVAYRTWSSEESWLVLGASGRVEVDGRTSLGVVPRVELSYDADLFLLRPGLGAPLVVAPFTMFGVEGSLTAQMSLTGSLVAVAMLTIDAYLFGSDVPDGSVVLMFNGAVGVGLEL